MKQFAELGAFIEQRWRERQFDENVFPALAAAALKEFNPAAQVSAWDVAAWAMREPTLPQQRDLQANFGDPPVTLFNSSRFHIDVYFWLQSTTAVHQHGFCGAFQVLLGGSLHSSYQFTEHERVNFHCAIGEIRLKNAEWLKIGDIKEIHGGNAFIHSLFHLENPSATIVVRTHSLPLGLPQFSYYKPSLAHDPFFDDATFIKKRQFVSMLLNTRNPNADALILELLETADFHTAAEFLLVLKSNLGFQNNAVKTPQADEQKRRFDAFLTAVQNKFPQWAEVLPAVFAEQERQLEITRRRSFVVASNHRYFLALLLNIDDKERVFELVKERVPEQNPLETILDWFDELGRTRVAGTNENALGIEDFSDQYTFVLEGMLKGKTADEIENEIRAEFSEAHAAAVKHQFSVLKNSPLLQSLWF
jgi:hypothetical protein